MFIRVFFPGNKEHIEFGDRYVLEEREKNTTM